MVTHLEGVKARIPQSNPGGPQFRQKNVSEVGFWVNVLSTWQDKNPGLVGLWTSRTGFGHPWLKQSCPIKLNVNHICQSTLTMTFD